MPGCQPGDMAKIIGGPSAGGIVHVDRDATEDETGWRVWPRSKRWFVVTTLQPPPAVDALGEPWQTGIPTVAPDESLQPIRPGELDAHDPRDVTVPVEEIAA